MPQQGDRCTFQHPPSFSNFSHPCFVITQTQFLPQLALVPPKAPSFKPFERHMLLLNNHSQQQKTSHPLVHLKRYKSARIRRRARHQNPNQSIWGNFSLPCILHSTPPSLLNYLLKFLLLLSFSLLSHIIFLLHLLNFPHLLHILLNLSLS